MVLSDKLKRSVTLTLAALLFLASLVPLLTRQTAGAYALLGPRNIRLSSSASGTAPDGDGDGTGDGINVTYRVEFTVTTDTTDIGGIVVTFCENSPIIGDSTCTIPAGFDIATPGVANQTGISGFTLAASQHGTGTTDNTAILTNATPYNPGAAQVISFELTGITNPTASNSTFYARIYTYDTDTEASAYTLADPDAGGASIDAGGIALSTANQITITSKVQERLTFCVYTQLAAFTPGPSGVGDNHCTAKTGNTINLGDANGVLDSAEEFVDKTAYFGVTTNAAGQAAIRMKGDTLELTDSCAAGSCRIEAVGATAALSDDGTEQFGMCLYEVDGSGLAIADGVTPAGPDYTGSGTGGAGCDQVTQKSGADLTGGTNGASFAFDTTNLNTTYGQVIASKPAGTFSTGNLAFVGNVSDTTEPGIYTTTLTFVATGTY